MGSLDRAADRNILGAEGHSPYHHNRVPHQGYPGSHEDRQALGSAADLGIDSVVGLVGSHQTAVVEGIEVEGRGTGFVVVVVEGEVVADSEELAVPTASLESASDPFKCSIG